MASGRSNAASTLRQAGESVDAVIGRALAALERLAAPVSSHEAESVPSHETMPVADSPAEPPAPVVLTPQARKAALLARLQQMQAQGMSLRAMAGQLNAAGVPTISGRGTWQAGTIGNLLAAAETSPPWPMRGVSLEPTGR